MNSRGETPGSREMMKGMMKRVGAVVLLTCLLSIPVAAIPPLPNEFSGTVTIDGNPAPAGTVIVAKINGTERGSLETTAAGVFGGSGPFDPRLVVSATDEDMQGGEPVTITFWVGESQAATTATFTAGAVSVIALDFPSPKATASSSVVTNTTTTPPKTVVTTTTIPAASGTTSTPIPAIPSPGGTQAPTASITQTIPAQPVMSVATPTPQIIYITATPQVIYVTVTQNIPESPLPAIMGFGICGIGWSVLTTRKRRER